MDIGRDPEPTTTNKQMITTTDLKQADLFTLFGALQIALEEVHTGNHEERTACLALATQINEEIGRRV